MTGADWRAWQQSWDRQQEWYMPDREERFRVMLDMVEALVHWLRRPLAALYGQIAGLVREGGAFINADHMIHAETLRNAGFGEARAVWAPPSDTLLLAVK
ncbi:hypothetical protein [Streptomyces sp. SLBN-118]|uniref:hypothetical protein n=1 Tax=Streptomyces sp. SLBN-118 TaxID=2768454 RepID=UPI00114EFA2A|nr:hypothetical protein [Streptomyces sp. SLBN-118]